MAVANNTVWDGLDSSCDGDLVEHSIEEVGVGLDI